MTAKGKLTEKQEGFAFAVGYESKSYSQAYRENYKVKPETSDKTVWRNAYSVATNTKVSARIDYWKTQRIEESKREFSWDLKEAEKELRAIIKKNKNDLLRAEQLGENANPAIINTSISAIKVLNETFDKITKDYSDLQKRKDHAEVEILENKNELLKGSLGETNGDEKISIELNI